MIFAKRYSDKDIMKGLTEETAQLMLAGYLGPEVTENIRQSEAYRLQREKETKLAKNGKLPVDPTLGSF